MVDEFQEVMRGYDMPSWDRVDLLENHVTLCENTIKQIYAELPKYIKYLEETLNSLSFYVDNRPIQDHFSDRTYGEILSLATDIDQRVKRIYRLGLRVEELEDAIEIGKSGK